jgi:hypothetical protein
MPNAGVARNPMADCRSESFLNGEVANTACRRHDGIVTPPSGVVRRAGRQTIRHQVPRLDCLCTVVFRPGDFQGLSAVPQVSVRQTQARHANYVRGVVSRIVEPQREGVADGPSARCGIVAGVA